MAFQNVVQMLFVLPLFLILLRVIGYRQWCNKLWNATRFAMSKLGDDYTPPPPSSINADVIRLMPFSCQWILSVLNKAVEETDASLEAYNLSGAASKVYSWWQFQLCFIELIKPYFSSNGQSFASARKDAQDALWVCLDTGLRLLHPFMPFVTEELWQRLTQPKDAVKKESIVTSKYPSVEQEWTNENVEHEMEMIESAVKSLRSLKSLLPAKDRHERREAFALYRNEKITNIIGSHEFEILTLAGLSSLKILNENDAAPAGCSVDVVNENLSVYLKLKGSVNAEVDREKSRKKMEETKRQQATLQKMDASGYSEKVASNIHEVNVAKLTKVIQEVLSLEEASQHLEQDIVAQSVAVENNE